MATLRVEYRDKCYKFADALRPDPMWGRRSFLVKTEDLGTEDINKIERKARDPDAVPDGMCFHSITRLPN